MLFRATSVSAEPLCIAKWSVLSLWIKYCGSFFYRRFAQPCAACRRPNAHIEKNDILCPNYLFAYEWPFA